MIKRKWELALLLSIACGCTGESIVGTTVDPNAPPAPSDGLQVSLGHFNVPPGTEVQLCRTMKLPNSDPLFINRIEILHEMEGLHHAAIFRSSQSYDDQIFPCWETLSPDWTMVARTNWAGNFDWSFPNAVFEFDPHQQILILAHFVNATTVQAPKGGQVYFNLHETSDGSLPVAHAMMVSNTRISIAPHSAYTINENCTFDQSVYVIGLVGQFNARGIELSAARLDASQQIGEQIYDDLNWDSPPYADLLGDSVHGLLIPAGEGLALTCKYFNNTNQDIGWGIHADTQEQCDLLVYYTNVDPDVSTPLACQASQGGGW